MTEDIEKALDALAGGVVRAVPIKGIDFSDGDHFIAVIVQGSHFRFINETSISPCLSMVEKQAETAAMLLGLKYVRGSRECPCRLCRIERDLERAKRGVEFTTWPKPTTPPEP